ncbi:hypothetical protein ACSNOI_45620, partial [Actinomadura kijaniata]|uniref:hypothetical protein n=1 Tax=Actinomadura kijaniata TaxID=46161 RepID=UPI003F1A5A7D
MNTHDMDPRGPAPVFPHPVTGPLDGDLIDRWNRYFAGDHERDRTVEEGLWRRTQEPANIEQSRWAGPGDARRRMVHYHYRYDLHDSAGGTVLAMVGLYLSHSVTAPAAEIAVHRKQLADSFTAGGWVQVDDGLWALGDLRCRLTAHTVHPEDAAARRRLPEHYRSLDLVLTSDGYWPDEDTRAMPWQVLAAGMRIPEQRGNPELVTDLSALAEFTPFMVEMGCGPSTEAGIPPLHRLHEVYRVTIRDHDDAFTTVHPFTLDPVTDPLPHELLRGPERKLPELTEMFTACFMADPTPAHGALARMADAGHIVGPIITHNFDVLCGRAGLAEHYVRR